MPAYLSGFGRHHVVAIQRGFGALQRRCDRRPSLPRLGGPGPEGGTLHFDSDALSLLRGFPIDSFAGSHVALVNAEYRWPLARPQRGMGDLSALPPYRARRAGGDAGHPGPVPIERMR